MRRPPPTLLRAALLWLFLFAGPAFAGSNKVVVELFTSQGCSSCPPADALLRELAERKEVIALSFHVDYWNYLGWADPFSSRGATMRQKAYRPMSGLRYIYTPQMVIGGAVQVTGSDREKVLREIDARRRQDALGVAVRSARGGGATLVIEAGPRPSAPAAIWAFVIDRRHTTKIANGENGGVKLINANVVRIIRRLGEWSGERQELPLDLAALGAGRHDACAIVVQREGQGPVLGATLFPLPKDPS